MAIDDPLDEQEQSERVLNWLRNNGAGLIGGVVLGLAVIFGWQWWQKHQLQQRAQEHARYEAALASAGGGDLDKASKDAAALDDGSAYTGLAALRLAKAQFDADQRDAAIATLRGIPAGSALRAVAEQRLARLLIDAGKADEAVKLLEGREGAAALEIRGDALVALNKTEDARAAYAGALTGMDVAAPQRRLVELKLADAGGTVPKPAEPI